MNSERFTYENAGVFKDKRLARMASEIARTTKNEYYTEVVPTIFIRDDAYINKKFKSPISKEESDGIGDKENILADLDRADVAGHDIVVANTNDILKWGLLPIGFQLTVEFNDIDDTDFENLVQSAADTCRQMSCMISGGETAQKPGFMKKGRFHLNATAIGVGEKDKFISGQRSKVGDFILGLPSVGIHTNGYSLALKLFELQKINIFKEEYKGHKLTDLLLSQHKNYYQAVRTLIENDVEIHRIVHVTGEGLSTRAKERLSDNLDVELFKDSHPIPPIFPYLKNTGNLSDTEMHKTFNMGVGMLLDLPKKEIHKAQRLLKDLGEESYKIGKVISKSHS